MTRPDTFTALTFTAAALTFLCGGSAQAADMEREFDINLSISGDQHWVNGQQNSQATTTQSYRLSTHLHSDGIRYAENYLDMNITERLQIKEDYLTRQGLIKIKQENGGKLPHTPQDIQQLDQRVRREGSTCAGGTDCSNDPAERFAALGALQNNSAEDLEQFMQVDTPTDSSGYYYFFGYAGCPNRLHITNTTHIAGRKAFDSQHKEIESFSVDRVADSAGNADDQKNLCKRYTITLDAKTGAMFVENAFLPSPPGTSVSMRSKGRVESNLELPVPAEVLEWTATKLRQTQSSGHITDTLRILTPLDSDRTPLGMWDGSLKVSLDWALKPVDGLPAK